jgi:hypothetical protein
LSQEEKAEKKRSLKMADRALTKRHHLVAWLLMGRQKSKERHLLTGNKVAISKNELQHL